MTRIRIKPDKGSAAAVDGRSTDPASVPAGQENEATQTSPEPEIHPVMSFFKTLVNKPVPKSEEDVKREAEDKKNGGLRKSSSRKEKAKSAVQESAQTELKGHKADGQKSSTLGRLFRSKSKKDEVPAGADKVVLVPPTVSVSLNSQQSAPEAAALDKPSNVPPQITASAEEGRSAKEAAPRPRLFWRKSFKGDPQPTTIQENGVDEPTVVSVSPAPEAVLTVDTNLPDTSIQPLQEEVVKEPPPRPLPFWRKSFKADPPPSKTPENGVDAQAVVTVSPAPEAVLTLDTNLPDTSVQPPQEEVVKEPPSRPLPFWRKSFKVDSPPPKTQETVAIEQPVASVSVNMEQSIPPQAAAIETALAEADTPPAGTEKPVKEASSRAVPFWRKSFKGEPQSQKAQENIAVELPVVSASVNAEQSAPQSVTAAQDIKPADVTVTLPESEKPSKEAGSRPVPFWRKSFKGDPPPPPPAKSQDNSSTEAESQSAKPDSKAKGSGSTAEGKSPEGKKPEEGKSTKPKIMMFFKQLSVIGDPSNIPSEEVNGKSKDSPTLDISDGVELGKTEKTVVTAVVEPPPAPPLQKMKENAKEKKASSEKLTKHESRECLDVAASSQVQVPEPATVLNGAESSKESQLKRTEKRQSLGSFFKAIGPKRLCDAEVQTDPVSILPAEKAK
ncbi:breast carcinoma-amplified sequence 1 isoform X4 [Hyperolius riggenbachi]|uniref:breast carcinoma-amplified sequence 1 isoform X4 n=1 Tax=Hyperolius riggenbachi TaxID=752182 RepID=UPI0035A32EA8